MNVKQIPLPQQYKFWTGKAPDLGEDWNCKAVHYRFAMKACKNKQELEALKNDNPADLELIKWTYKNLPDLERAKIDKICFGSEKKATPEHPYKVGSTVKILSDRWENAYYGRYGQITAVTSDSGFPILVEGEDAPKYFMIDEVELIAPGPTSQPDFNSRQNLSQFTLFRTATQGGQRFMQLGK